MTTQQITHTLPEALVDKAIRRPLIMAVLNITPDSFSDGGQFDSPAKAVANGQRLITAGADLLDIGGESTRPGSRPVAAAEQWARIGDVVNQLAGTGVPLSVDTRSAEVARKSLAAGAAVINDVSAGRHDPALFPLVAEHGATIVLMHMQGEPHTMQAQPTYADCSREVADFLVARAAAAERAGIARERIWIDPGIGFGKTLDHNLQLLVNLPRLVETGYPVLLGTSRKSFIGRICEAPPDRRLGGSLASLVPAFTAGVHCVRVHDVAETHQFLELLTRLMPR
jgi:dihydropteroate synthase